MRYVSTRGGAPAVNFSQAMLAGLAPDGGLYVPEKLPVISQQELCSWKTMDYQELAAEVVWRFAPEMSRSTIEDACTSAYSPDVFGSKDVVPISELGDGTYLMHLSNGPTLAFKDIAMQLLGRLLDAELGRRGDRCLVVGATSGDTGSAAEHAMIGRNLIGVVMLSPHGKVTPFQAAQMFALDEPNIVNLAIRGVFDEAQDLVKAVQADQDFKARHSIGAVNSINWARIVAQIVYYIWAALRLSPGLKTEVQVAVPTGNFGNIYAGTVARALGLPLRLILATNENKVLTEFFATGRYRVRPTSEVVATSSPSMDIAKASNFERLVWDLHGGEGAAVGLLWDAIAESGEINLGSSDEFNQLADGWIVAGSSTHADRIETIRRVAVEHGVVIDPHTADGIGVASRLRNPDLPLVCLETALPTKFEPVVTEALGGSPPRPAHLVGLEDRPQQVTIIDPDVTAVRAAVEQLSERLGS